MDNTSKAVVEAVWEIIKVELDNSDCFQTNPKATRQGVQFLVLTLVKIERKDKKFWSKFAKISGNNEQKNLKIRVPQENEAIGRYFDIDQFSHTLQSDLRQLLGKKIPGDKLRRIIIVR